MAGTRTPGSEHKLPALLLTHTQADRLDPPQPTADRKTFNLSRTEERLT